MWKKVPGGSGQKAKKSRTGPRITRGEGAEGLFPEVRSKVYVSLSGRGGTTHVKGGPEGVLRSRQDGRMALRPEKNRQQEVQRMRPLETIGCVREVEVLRGIKMS